MDEKCKKIKVLFMDVDGTLTDGGMYMGNHGEIMKRFYVKDGYAIHDMLPKMEIIPIVITGRESKIVSERCRELGINRIMQNSKNKIEDMKKILRELGVSLEEAAYIGDDMNDYECMERVGIKGCPNDAVEKIKEISDYITIALGGYGAVREFIEWIDERRNEN